MDNNAEYTATSSMIVDLSGDNDNIGAITAANSLPKTSEDSPFERSCDNPECSAPKLISLVPKRETAEFITEPSVMNQPTLVNGFTTVFQVDGLAAKINDIMNGNFKGPTTSDGYGDQSNPKTVFRIVPNTHAHIVNYVVVDGAGETMRKIKSNDPDTMRKLLDSQRLSAEQMLKKLISKAFKTSSRKPDALMPLPIPSKVPGYTHLGLPSQDGGTVPPVPAGITITPVQHEQSQDSPLVINISSKELPHNTSDKHASKGKAAVTMNAGTSTKSMLNATGKMKNKTAAKDVAPRVTLPTVTASTATTPKVTSTKTTPASNLTSKITSAPKSTSQITSTSAKTNTLAPATTAVSPSTAQTDAGSAKQNMLKRKQVPITTPDAIKRLRPRSPKQKAPLAVGLEPASTFATPTRKLPTLPKLPTRPPATTDSSGQPNNPPKKAFHTDVTSPPKESSRSIAIAKAFASCLAEPEKQLSTDDLPAKVRSIIEPATKATAAAQTIKTTLAAKVTAALAGRSGITKIGETLITAAPKAREDKSAPADESQLSTKINEFLQKEAALKATTSKPSAASLSTTVLTTVSKLTSTGPKIIAQTKTNLEPIKLSRQTSSPERDPLAFDDLEEKCYMISKPAPDAAPVTRLGKTLMTKSTPKEAEAPSEQIQTLPTLPTLADAKASAKTPVITPMKTRGSNPRSATVTPSITKPGKVPTPSAASTRSLRVVLPALKSGIMTLPVRSPHPNLKISSVMSGGSAVAAAYNPTATNPKPSESEEKEGSEIDKLQQELADLRRTVQRLSRKKP